VYVRCFNLHFIFSDHDDDDDDDDDDNNNNNYNNADEYHIPFWNIFIQLN
jgi:hypothetical protein